MVHEELVAALGVSRAGVREALRVLEAMGIIEAHAGSGRSAGSVVTGRPTAALTSLLRLHMALARISGAELAETRAQLERSSVRDNALTATLVASLRDVAEVKA